MNVYQKLIEARAKFHALKLEKTGENKFAGYKYFELGDFLIPALGVLKDVGLCALPVSFVDGRAVMTLVDVDKTDDRIVFESPMGSAALKGCHEVQNIGAVETYQRRYLWVAALEIVEHDALDATTGSDKPEPPKMIHKPTDGAWDRLDNDQQMHCQLVASIIEPKFEKEGIEPVCDLLDKEDMDSDMKLGLWHLLAKNSKLRNAIKKEQERRRLMKTDGKAKQADVYRTAETH